MIKNDVLKFANDVFDAGCGFPAPTVFIWAADHAIDAGIEVSKVKEDIKAINRTREKFGMIPVYVPFGHRAF